MTLDPTILPGLLLLLLELLTLAAVGFVVARTALQQPDARLALAHGLVIGPALWGLTVNFLLHLLPGLAGAGLAWALILALAAGLAWRAPHALRLPPRTLAAFLAATLAILWLTLAARQLLKIPDPTLHLGLAAYIRAGGWPPINPWNPDFTLYYHHGVDLLIGLLAPPLGPDLVLVTELVSAYIWTSFALVVATALLKRGGWLSVIVLSPLMLTAGLWTLIGQLHQVPNVMQVPLPAAWPTTEALGSLSEIYWPHVPLRWFSEFDGSPANIWKPTFVLGYALVFVILHNTSTIYPSTGLARTIIAAIVGFLGIVSEELALLVVGLWYMLLVSYGFKSPVERRHIPFILFQSLFGPAFGMLLVAVSGGTITALATGEPRPEIAFSWVDIPWERQPWGRFEPLSGGVGLLGAGALSTATLAALLAYRDRNVLSLAVGAFPLMAAALTLQYKAYPLDVTRFDGHARNFALLALLLALAPHLSDLSPRWQRGAGLAIVALLVWPTVALPARTVVLGLSRGVHLANPAPGILASDSNPWHYDLRRFVIDVPVSAQIVNYIHRHTPADARVFSPHPRAISMATGRPNAMGFAGHHHLVEPNSVGPSYEDVSLYLEPAAVRRLGFDYLHATDRWVNNLPARAREWLNDPQLFELLVQTETDSILRVRPVFLNLDVQPNPESFEALRKAIPDSAAIYLAPTFHPVLAVRLAVSLPHAQLRGSLDVDGYHMQTEIPISPLGNQTPDFVALPARMAPSALPPSARQPVWWNQHVAIFAPDGSAAPQISPPPPHFSVQLSDVRAARDRIAFTATFTDRATDRWQGQDWVVVQTDASPWRLPYRFGTGTFTAAFSRWFDGQVQPVPETDTHEYFFLYEFDPRTGTLALWDGAGYSDLSSPQPQLRPGNWMLAVRPNVNREEVGLIPVLHFTLADDGTFSYKVYEGSLDAMLVR